MRYADDIVVGFEHQADAERFLAEMRERLAAFALTLHREKTRLIEFGRFAALNRSGAVEGKPETFNFLGFTHICGRSRARWLPAERKSRRDRMRAQAAGVKEDCGDGCTRRSTNRAMVAAGGGRLVRLPRGADQREALSAFRYHVIQPLAAHASAAQPEGQDDVATDDALADRWLPQPRITHPWPRERFAVKHPRWEPYAGIPPVRFCAGGAQ